MKGIINTDNLLHAILDKEKRVVAERKNPHAFGSDGNSYLS